MGGRSLGTRLPWLLEVGECFVRDRGYVIKISCASVLFSCTYGMFVLCQLMSLKLSGLCVGSSSGEGIFHVQGILQSANYMHFSMAFSVYSNNK